MVPVFEMQVSPMKGTIPADSLLAYQSMRSDASSRCVHLYSYKKEDIELHTRWKELPCGEKIGIQRCCKDLINTPMVCPKHIFDCESVDTRIAQINTKS